MEQVPVPEHDTIQRRGPGLSVCPYCGNSHGTINHNACPHRDLLAEAARTGRIHAQRGAACNMETAAEMFGAEAAAAYERGYRYEIENNRGDSPCATSVTPTS